MKEIFDQENPDTKNDVSSTEPIDNRAVEIGTKFGVGEVPEFDDRADQSKIGAIRQGLGSQSTPSKTEMKARISVEDEVQNRQIIANRKRAGAKEGVLMRLSKTKVGKPIFASLALVLSAVGIGGGVKVVEHLQNADRIQESNDFTTAQQASETEINNMNSQLADPGLSNEARATLEENISTAEAQYNAREEAHKNYVTEHGSPSVQATDQGVNATTSDGTQYSSIDSSENQSK